MNRVSPKANFCKPFSKRFCPKCGKETLRPVKGFCAECFALDHALVELPKEIRVEFCKRCNKIRLKGQWNEQDERLLKDFVSSKLKEKELRVKGVKVNLQPLAEGSTVAELNISGTVDGEEISLIKQALLKPKRGICDACMKLASDYYEAILQLRFKEKKNREREGELKKKIERILKEKKKLDSLAKVIAFRKDRKGFDALIGSKKAAKDVAEALAKKAKTSVVFSHSVVGMDKNGKQKKRFTFCVKV